jgi:hypothetical protein
MIRYKSIMVNADASALMKFMLTATYSVGINMEKILPRIE